MDRKSADSILFLIIIIISTVNQTSSSVESPDCTNRWIHIRRLPPRFNLDLLTNCSQYPLLYDFCPYLPNHGLGPKTHSRTQSWFRTDPLLLELSFHRRLLDFPCLTSDPRLASAVFLPYYASLDSLRFLYGPDVNRSAEHGLDLYAFLREDEPDVWGRHLGSDHFLVMSRPAWDFSQPLDLDPPIWGTSFLELPEFYNVTALVVEGRSWAWQEQAIPYPTSFHPPTLALLQSWIHRVRVSRRSTFMMFAGGGGVASSTPNIRRSIRNECENATANVYFSKLCDVVDCSNGVCEHDPIRYMRPMLRSTFCLQPPGDTPTRRSTFDSIIAGCIPVFFEELSAKAQYGWHLPPETYEEFAVIIPKEEVVFKGTSIMDVLMGIPRDRVRKMREKVIEMIPRVVYRKHGSSLEWTSVKDAFDIAIDGVLERIHYRINGGFGFDL